MSQQPLNVVALNPCDHIPSMLRSLADDIERGAVQADEVHCIVRTGTDTVTNYTWGDYRGPIATLGLLESAKALLGRHTEPG